jgi:hypothetical protein
MKRARSIACVVVITLIALVFLPAAAQEESVLKGMGGVRFEIAGDNLPVPAATLRADVEQRLREAGIIVDPLRAARLRLLIASFRPDGLPTNYVYSAQLQLDERALTRRGLSAEVVTWESETVLGLAILDDTERFRASIQNLVQEFIRAYVAANPK